MPIIDQRSLEVESCENATERVAVAQVAEDNRTEIQGYKYVLKDKKGTSEAPLRFVSRVWSDIRCRCRRQVQQEVQVRRGGLVEWKSGTPDRGHQKVAQIKALAVSMAQNNPKGLVKIARYTVDITSDRELDKWFDDLQIDDGSLYIYAW